MKGQTISMLSMAARTVLSVPLEIGSDMRAK